MHRFPACIESVNRVTGLGLQSRFTGASGRFGGAPSEPGTPSERLATLRALDLTAAPNALIQALVARAPVSQGEAAVRAWAAAFGRCCGAAVAWAGEPCAAAVGECGCCVGGLLGQLHARGSPAHAH
mgnify:CR=1 FL=1